MSFLVKGNRNWKPETNGKLENSHICKNNKVIRGSELKKKVISRRK